MRFVKTGIATANINGLSKEPFYFGHHCYWACEIYFSDSSSTRFYNIPVIAAGNTKEEAEEFKKQLLENFEQAGIKDGDKVTVIFNERNRDVIAIGSFDKDIWIDTNDEFTVKNFNDLNIIITSLKVY